jgi:hypothetical protein
LGKTVNILKHILLDKQTQQLNQFALMNPPVMSEMNPPVKSVLIFAGFNFCYQQSDRSELSTHSGLEAKLLFPVL